MKKTIFSVILMTFAMVLGSCCNGKENATAEAQNDSTVLAAPADSVVIDNVAVVEADSIKLDSVTVAE